MKKIFYLLFFTFLIVSCSKNQEIELEATPENQDLLSKKQINNVIRTSVETTGDFNWSKADINVIYSAVKLGDGILTVGYGSSTDEFARSVNSSAIKDELLKIVYQNEKITNSEVKSEVKLYVDEDINFFDVKVENRATIEVLLKDARVRYVEPSGYRLEDVNEENRSSSSSLQGLGCGFRTEALDEADYRVVAPGALVPWTFDEHNIPAAWNYSTGRGVGIAVIDTGLSPEQYYMNGGFNDGYSSGRTVSKKAFYVDSWWWWSTSTDGVNDKCGHGTSMSSVATAPRNNDNLPVGVAYNANLTTYRATKNVLLDGYHEQKGVANALKDIAKNRNVKVVSMSIGYIFTINRIKDAVRYAHSRGKLIFAAGGTSTSVTNWFGVIFPATMNEVVAVTGVKENQYKRCDNCHSGSKIDFTIEMERSNGNHVPVLSYYNGQTDYVGGSSVATATTAGIAALVWAKHPGWSKDQVLQKMKQAADFYPSKNSEYGYGNIDALKAVR